MVSLGRPIDAVASQGFVVAHAYRPVGPVHHYRSKAATVDTVRGGVQLLR